MPDWTEGTITINGARIHYTRTGGDRPPLVAVHGFTDNGLCWTRVARAMANDYDIIMLDLRGHGLSERIEPGAVVDPAADLIDLIEGLGLGRPALLGHSLGAATAALAAARVPERVGLLVMEDPPWRPQPPAGEESGPLGERRQHLEDWYRELAQLQAQPREAIVATCRSRRPDWDETDIDTWADAKLQVDLNVFRGSLLNMPPWQETVPEVTCPALLITGDPELGAIVTPEVSQEVARRLPQVEIVQIPGAGHSIRRDRYEAALQTIAGFLQAHGEALC